MCSVWCASHLSCNLATVVTHEQSRHQIRTHRPRTHCGGAAALLTTARFVLSISNPTGSHRRPQEAGNVDDGGLRSGRMGGCGKCRGCTIRDEISRKNHYRQSAYRMSFQSVSSLRHNQSACDYAAGVDARHCFAHASSSGCSGGRGRP